MQPGDVVRTAADISAIVGHQGYRPMTTIDAGMPQFVPWYRDYHKLMWPSVSNERLAPDRRVSEARRLDFFAPIDVAQVNENRGDHD